MNKFQLSYLAAKDYMVARHKFGILFWSFEQWRGAVDDLAANLRADDNTDWMKPYE